jgi:hypothetical protein
MSEARKMLALKSKTDTVIAALRELIRRGHVKELKEMAGHVELEIDVAQYRRRSRSTSRHGR